MNFMVHIPYGPREPYSLLTFNSVADQTWLELTSIRFKRSRRIAAPRATAHWIDQAKTYYTDAMAANWRTACLLYYYSYLNLAKALLVAKRKFTFAALNTTAAYHGLGAELQDLNEIVDFQLTIHPPTSNGRANIFAHLYELLTGTPWPFQQRLTLALRDFAPYCADVNAELSAFFQVPNRNVEVYSLLRGAGQQAWFEMRVPAYQAQVVIAQLPALNLQTVLPLSEDDKEAWLHAFHLSALTFQHVALLRSAPVNRQGPEPEFAAHLQLMQLLQQQVAPFAYPSVYSRSQPPSWLFLPDIALAQTNLRWHPILSNYLVAFICATVLRYQPQLLKPDSRSAFLIESWAKQAPLSVLQYFLMEFTTPPLWIKSC